MDSLETGRIRARMPSPIFLPPSHWLGKLFTLPQLSTVFLIQDGSLNNWISTRAAKIRLHCRLSYNLLKAPYPLLALIICCYGRLSCSISGHWSRWGCLGCSFSLTVAGFSLPYFVLAFLAICYRWFCQSVCFARLLVVLRFSLSLLVVFTVSVPIFSVLLCSLLHVFHLSNEYFSCSPNMFLYFV